MAAVTESKANVANIDVETRSPLSTPEAEQLDAPATEPDTSCVESAIDDNLSKTIPASVSLDSEFGNGHFVEQPPLSPPSFKPRGRSTPSVFQGEFKKGKDKGKDKDKDKNEDARDKKAKKEKEKTDKKNDKASTSG